MIDPRYADRLGFSVGFMTGDRERAGQAASRLMSLGVRHVRLTLSTADLADGGWLAWMLESFGRDFILLPSIDAAVPEDALHGLLNKGGLQFKQIELRDAATHSRCGASALIARADLARAAGCDVAVSIDADTSVDRIDAYGRDGLLDLTVAIGLECLRPGHKALNDLLIGAQQAAQQYKPSLQLWLAAVGESTWRGRIARQVEVFHDALSSSAQRFYWHTLSDDAWCDTHGRHAFFGVDNAQGPKLLGRMLDDGATSVEQIINLVHRQPAPAIIGIKPVLVTGGAGFIGANLADALAADGQHVEVFDALARPGVERNLRWLSRNHPAHISFVLGDVRDEDATCKAAAQASMVFHLAGQVAVTTSMVDPLADFEVNARGTLAILEALRQHNPTTPLIFASTNKVYGNLADIELARDGDRYLPKSTTYRMRGVSEARPLCFHTPYGCSKGTADQYVLDYAHSFGLRTAVLRMSCIYGERQLGTEDQGWVAHFLLRAIAGEQITIYGDGRQVRDILHVGDAVAAYRSAWHRIDAIAGRAYNLGGGPDNAISLLQLIEHIEILLGRRVDVEFSAWRPGDQRYFVADTTAIRHDLDLPVALDWKSGLHRLAAHFGVSLDVAEPVEEAAL